ncbi:lecithin retinol acyltransferase family protein [Marinobacterium maritimum]|uniref:Lecithin retinol acyltransferase family protein n=1 Tax=Marinobacterium maritimum TaxID=500162 RepID=A0ABN1I4D5_9GAMM
MTIQTVLPGNVVVTDFGAYQHFSLASDQLSSNGFPKLISATKRTGTVQEEEWDAVTQGKTTFVAKVPETDLAVSVILERARSHIGQWKYSITGSNCEHFVNTVRGLKFDSKQVSAGVSGAMLGAALVGTLSEKPTTFKFLLGALAVGGIAVAASKVKSQDKPQ